MDRERALDSPLHSRCKLCKPGGVDDSREIDALHPGLTTVDAWRSVDLPHLDALPRSGRIQMKVVSSIPKLRDVGKVLRLRW